MADALRERKAKLEAEERDIQHRTQAVADAEAEILKHALRQAAAKLHKLDKAVSTLRDAIWDQRAVESVAGLNRYEAPSIFELVWLTRPFLRGEDVKSK